MINAPQFRGNELRTKLISFNELLNLEDWDSISMQQIVSLLGEGNFDKNVARLRPEVRDRLFKVLSLSKEVKELLFSVQIFSEENIEKLKQNAASVFLQREQLQQGITFILDLRSCYKNSKQSKDESVHQVVDFVKLSTMAMDAKGVLTKFKKFEYRVQLKSKKADKSQYCQTKRESLGLWDHVLGQFIVAYESTADLRKSQHFQLYEEVKNALSSLGPYIEMAGKKRMPIK